MKHMRKRARRLFGLWCAGVLALLLMTPLGAFADGTVEAVSLTFSEPAPDTPVSEAAGLFADASGQVVVASAEVQGADQPMFEGGKTYAVRVTVRANEETGWSFPVTHAPDLEQITVNGSHEGVSEATYTMDALGHGEISFTYTFTMTAPPKVQVRLVQRVIQGGAVISEILIGTSYWQPGEEASFDVPADHLAVDYGTYKGEAAFDHWETTNPDIALQASGAAVPFPMPVMTETLDVFAVYAAPEAETLASETAPPETPAPETAPPETPAPETAPPQTPAPETAPPETPAPETPAPEIPPVTAIYGSEEYHTYVHGESGTWVDVKATTGGNTVESMGTIAWSAVSPETEESETAKPPVLRLPDIWKNNTRLWLGLTAGLVVLAAAAGIEIAVWRRKKRDSGKIRKDVKKRKR